MTEALQKISRERFIRLGSALGVAAATASMAACGGGGSAGSGGGNAGSGNGGSGNDSGGGSGGEKAGSSSGDGGAQGGGAAIVRASEVAPGSAVAFKEGGQDAVLVHLENGDFVAYSAVCTHQACTVAYKNGQLACPCHGSVFDPATGAEVVTGPAERPLEEIPVEVRGGQVLRA